MAPSPPRCGWCHLARGCSLVGVVTCGVRFSVGLPVIRGVRWARREVGLGEGVVRILDRGVHGDSASPRDEVVGIPGPADVRAPPQPTSHWCG
jgi:hypothetical protein